MSENKDRALLDDEILEAVAGGNVLYVCTKEDHYCWGARNPGVRYGYQSLRKVLAFIQENYDYYGEAGIFNAMMAAGLVTKMN